jgi:hypothetical protein
LADSEFSFVLAGGTLRAVPRLAADLQTLLRELAPNAAIVRLEREPALGAVAIALAEAQGTGRLPIYKTT